MVALHPCIVAAPTLKLKNKTPEQNRKKTPAGKKSAKKLGNITPEIKTPLVYLPWWPSIPASWQLPP
jgi:hypothetical protein